MNFKKSIKKCYRQTIRLQIIEIYDFALNKPESLICPKNNQATKQLFAYKLFANKSCM